MKAEVYVIGLFTFRKEEEENIVFSSKQLNTINKNIEINLDVKGTGQESKWVTYNLNQKEITSYIPLSNCRLIEAEMGYYHHRVIFRFVFEGENVNSEVREIREGLRSYTIARIKNTIISPNQDFSFMDCDTYQLFIIHEGFKFFFKKEDPTFSNDTTTMSFDINEPRKISPIGRKYKFRISIPSTIIYTKSGVSNDLRKAMINSIYQYCLYEKKGLNKEKN